MSTVLHKVRSKDGTSIAYEKFGAGQPFVLVHGGISDRTYWAPVVPALAQRCTVLTVDRRGRGASGDAASYAIDREFEDVAAVVDAIGEPVHLLLGHSYGGRRRARRDDAGCRPRGGHHRTRRADGHVDGSVGRGRIMTSVDERLTQTSNQG
ncbi:MAG: alpha/beta fold hydrolase [Pseudonocardiales bacterium]